MYITKKHSITRLLLFTGLIVALSACSTTSPTARHGALGQWVGHSYEKAVTQLGAPTDVFSDGMSGRVMVYRKVAESPAHRLASEVQQMGEQAHRIVWIDAHDRTVPTRIAQHHELLYVDRDGLIYSVQSNAGDRERRVQGERALIAVGAISAIALIALLATAN